MTARARETQPQFRSCLPDFELASRQWCASHMDHRLAARFDPLDVVQDTFARAWRELPDYLCRRPLPFYPWLREFAWKILIDLRRKHILLSVAP